MNFLKQSLFLTAAVLIVLCGQSVAGIDNEVSPITGEDSSFARLLRGSMVEGGRHRHYYDTIKYIQQQASQAPDSEANKIFLNGFLEVTDLIKSSARACYTGLREANNSVAILAPEAIIKIIETAFTKANMDIVNGGAVGYMVLGAVRQITDEGARQGLTEATDILTISGATAFGGYSASKDLAVLGVRSGKDAPVQALLAGFRGVQTTEQTVYNIFKKVVKRAYEALSDLPLSLAETSQNDLLKNSAAAESPKCQNAIESVQQSAVRALRLSTSEKKSKAIEVVRTGFIEALKTIALAGKSAYNTINEAREIPNKELALARVNGGIDEVKNKCVTAVSFAQQALGGARHIIGLEIEQPIIQAMIIIEQSRVALMQGLQNSLMIMNQGIENDAAAKAFEAGSDGTATSGFSAYAEIVKSADLAMSTIMSSLA